MMNQHRAAQVLFSTLRLVLDSDSIPVTGGVLDRVLEASLAEDIFEGFIGDLHFVETAVGRRCVELSGILIWALNSEIIRYEGFGHQWIEIKISRMAAIHKLRRLDINQSTIDNWCEILRKILGK